MAIKINFDGNNTPETPTLVLATKNGSKLGVINTIDGLVITDNFVGASEITFTVHKSLGDKECHLWDEIVDFKLLWCKEWDRWFEISVSISETDSLCKQVTAHTLGIFELSQINVYGLEVNTEFDISRDDYVRPTVLYDNLHPESSLLHRLLSKAPHYSIHHVDSSIAPLQRTFTFDGVSIVDALNSVAEELDCIFVYEVASDSQGNIERMVSAYDLEQTCLDCGYRGDYTDNCPKCNSTNITYGYGENTNIFISSENLTEEINYESNTSEVKNCFRLSAGDDLMTSVIASCNPSGNNYLWYIPDYLRREMSQQLQSKLNEYDGLSRRYTKEEVYTPNVSIVSAYNILVQKYVSGNVTLQPAPASTTGFISLLELLYNAYDFELYLQTTMMPYIQPSEKTAITQAALLTSNTLSPISLQTLNNNISTSTVESAIKVAVRLIIDTSKYNFTVNTSLWQNPNWSGTITVTSKTDSSDTCTTDSITIAINSDYEHYVEQLIAKKAKESDGDKYTTSGILSMSLVDMRNEIKLYSLDCLHGIHNCCQDIINILIEAGGGVSGSQIYTDLYAPYYNKLAAIQNEIDTRASEVKSIVDMEEEVLRIRDSVMSAMDFEDFLGSELWLELSSYRREQDYKNDNYISDGLSNSELITNALEFLDKAKNELYKSAMLQHKITTTLNNLLAIKEFEPLVDYFSVGNWITIRIDDRLYRLRLISYEIDYDSIEKIQVGFSDVKIIANGLSDLDSLLSKASSMSSTFSFVTRQANSGADGKNILANWIENGLAMTNAKILDSADNQNMEWDEHGILLRRKEPITEQYDPEQLRIINSTIAITDNNWQSVKTAIGKFFYYDPTSNSYKSGYGVNGETIVGKLILGEELGIYNTSGSLTFNKNGLSVSNTNNSVVINPNSTTLFKITKGVNDLLSVDSSGNLHINGEITASSGSIAGFTIESGAIRYGNLDSVADSSIALSSTTNFSRVINGSSRSNLRFAIGGKFGIAKDGAVYASGATISGAITATSLTLSSGLTVGTVGSSTTGVSISSSGKLSASDAEIRGSITATSLSLTSGLSVGSYGTNSTGVSISSSGQLQASNATLRGSIYASGGKIGGFNIGANSISTSNGLGITLSSNSESTYILDIGDGVFRVSNEGDIEAMTLQADGVNATGLYGEYVEADTGSITTLSCSSELNINYVKSHDIQCISGNANNMYFGPSSDYSNVYTSVRGNNVKLYAHTGGAVYVGSSGTEVVTSDETMKDLFEIDSRYEDFFMNLHPILYTYKRIGHRKHIGYGARAVESALLNAGLTTEEFAGVLIDKDVTICADEAQTETDQHYDELYSLRYEEFGPLYAHMLQKAIKTIRDLEDRIQRIENANF